MLKESGKVEKWLKRDREVDIVTELCKYFFLVCGVKNNCNKSFLFLKQTLI